MHVSKVVKDLLLVPLLCPGIENAEADVLTNFKIIVDNWVLFNAPEHKLDPLEEKAPELTSLYVMSFVEANVYEDVVDKSLPNLKTVCDFIEFKNKMENKNIEKNFEKEK